MIMQPTLFNGKSEGYIKSPLNYVGGKFRLLSQILPHFPKDTDSFLDIFAGGGNIFANVSYANITANDKERRVIDLFQWIRNTSISLITQEIFDIIEKYDLSLSSKYGYSPYNVTGNLGLSTYNKERYIQLRHDYNASTRKTPAMFFTLIIFAFNSQIRFNKSDEFNMPVGKTDFNTNIQRNLVEFSENIKSISNLTLLSQSFENIPHPKPNTFIYADPPYLITTASYNEQDNWNEKKEELLLAYLDKHASNGGKFALSNVLSSKGQTNTILKKWSKKYHVLPLKMNYRSSNYQRKIYEHPDKEILVLSY